MRKLKQKLLDDEVVLHIDFVENWATKLSSEVMSKHFRASQIQVTLHNGVAYFAETSHSSNFSFSTISDSNRHDAAAVWNYLDPLLQQLRDAGIRKVYFGSDGPTTQHRNRTNFFLITDRIKQLGFDLVNWNFSEAGHGKGAVDGAEAALKRAADQTVANGGDLPSAEAMFNNLRKTSSIKLFYVPNMPS